MYLAPRPPNPKRAGESAACRPQARDTRDLGYLIPSLAVWLMRCPSQSCFKREERDSTDDCLVSLLHG